MSEQKGQQPESLGSLEGPELALLIERMPIAVSTVRADGCAGHANEKAMQIFARIADEPQGQLTEVGWKLVDGDGEPLDSSRLPSELTRTTGEEFENVDVGFPGANGQTVWIRTSTRRLSEEGPPYPVLACLNDASLERHARAEVLVAQQVISHSFDSAPIGIAIVSLDGRFVRVNRALCDLLGYSETELLATSFQDMTHPDDLEDDMALVEDVLSGRRSSYQMKKRYIRADGRRIWAQLTGALVQDEAGKPLHFVSQIQDVTEDHQLETRLRELADRDYLTGLLNRRRFEEELDRQLDRCSRHGEQAALLLLDIDHFKEANDSGGHAAGDKLLQMVAEVCEGRVRGTDLVARLGGDEFGAILVDSDEKGAHQVAEELLSALREVGDEPTTASIGLTIMRPDDQADAVLARADRALYAVKNDGRNGVRMDDSLTTISS
jgi:diguanylate cyclase (GGDEF)-like protein/PAS domain S-box-containing protein